MAHISRPKPNFTPCLTLSQSSEAAESGDIKKAFTPCARGCASLYGNNHPKWMKHFSGIDANEISDHLLLNQRDMLKKIKGDNRNSRDIVTLPTMAQFRTTRCIRGAFGADRFANVMQKPEMLMASPIGLALEIQDSPWCFLPHHNE